MPSRGPFLFVRRTVNYKLRQLGDVDGDPPSLTRWRHENTRGQPMADTDIDFDLLVKAGGPVRHFKAGDIIFREGDPAAELFVVKSGTVGIRIGSRLIDTLGERSIFGEWL